MLPARDISNRGAPKFIGYFASRESGLVKYESQLEMNMIYLLDSDPKVESIYGQPKTFKYFLNGSKRQYTPDLLVIYKNPNRKPMFIEVKYYSDFVGNRLKFRAVKNMMTDKGYDFNVITERYILMQPRLNNIKLLHRYQDIRIRKSSYKLINNYFASRSHEYLVILKRNLLDQGVSVNEFYAAFSHEVLIADINQPIDLEAVVFLNPKLKEAN